MKDQLAEGLLAKVMGWSIDRISEERPLLQAFALYKYDEYAQFSTGTRFIESLALWLRQFESFDERETAYQYFKQNLVFLSMTEMQHLVEMAYPDHIRPHLLTRAASLAGLNPHYRGKVGHSASFRLVQRSCLFLGLSDGARIDSFRRANPQLSHEQIWQTHELANERIDDLLGELRKDLKLLNVEGADKAQFETIVLLDDFSASGMSYYMKKTEVTYSGKVAKFFRRLTSQDDQLSKLAQLNNLKVIILLYAATVQARDYIKAFSTELWGNLGVTCDMEVVQLLPVEICLKRGSKSAFADLMENYYDAAVHDKHMAKGGTPDSRYGFADCGLPIVLHHNTPNNSVCLLWSYENSRLRGLFPRIQRHKSDL